MKCDICKREREAEFMNDLTIGSSVFNKEPVHASMCITCEIGLLERVKEKKEYEEAYKIFVRSGIRSKMMYIEEHGHPYEGEGCPYYEPKAVKCKSIYTADDNR